MNVSAFHGVIFILKMCLLLIAYTILDAVRFGILPPNHWGFRTRQDSYLFADTYIEQYNQLYPSIEDSS